MRRPVLARTASQSRLLRATVFRRCALRRSRALLQAGLVFPTRMEISPSTLAALEALSSLVADGAQPNDSEEVSRRLDTRVHVVASGGDAAHDGSELRTAEGVARATAETALTIGEQQGPADERADGDGDGEMVTLE